MFALDLIGRRLQGLWDNRLQKRCYDIAYAHTALCKSAGAPETAQSLVGTLYLSHGGWVLLSVPNSLGRGAFAALDEQGVELPKNSAGLYNAHVSVIRPNELEQIGGPGRITERGKQFRYTLGPVQTVKPDGWADVERVWMIRVHSPELERLRRSYGLSSLPNKDQYAFHITIGIRRSKVLQRNEISKAA
jgi:hypothetical protein